MAKILPSVLYSEAAGKLDNVIFQRNGSGAIVRGLTIPVQPNSDSQLESRSDMASAVLAWQEMSDSDRIKWIKLASSISAKSKARISRSISGYNLFLSRYLTLAKIDSSFFPAAVNPRLIPSGFVEFTSSSITNLRVTVTPDVVNNFGLLQAFVSPMVSPGIMSINSVPFIYLANYFTNGITVSDITNSYKALFGYSDLIVGRKIFVKIRGLERLYNIGLSPFISGAGAISRNFRTDSTVLV